MAIIFDPKAPDFLSGQNKRGIMKSYPCSIMEENINNLEVKLIGVYHEKPFFDEHRDFFEDKINISKAIFIENGPGVLSHEFYGELAELAKNNGIPIYIPDCASYSDLAFDMIQWAAGWGFLASGLTPNRSHSRREFFKKIGRSLFGAYLLSGTVIAKPIIWAVSDKPNMDMAIDDALDYGTVLDYRNLISAENLDKASRKIKIEGEVPYFIGEGHVEGIHAYLKHPWIRIKRLVYLPQDLMTDTAIKKYESKDGKWKLTESI